MKHADDAVVSEVALGSGPSARADVNARSGGAHAVSRTPNAGAKRAGPDAAEHRHNDVFVGANAVDGYTLERYAWRSTTFAVLPYRCGLTAAEIASDPPGAEK